MSEPSGAEHGQTTNHFRNVVLLWLLANVIMLPIVILVLGPGLPPGNGTVQSHGQVVDNTVLLAIATPVALAVLVYFGYALWAFRERNPEVIARRTADPRQRERPVLVADHDHRARAVPGRLRHGPAAGRRIGRRPGAEPDRDSLGAASGDPPLQVQVIAQQWEFTYRYPAYGGVETQQLELPANTLVEFNVTSLDVIHSFWAYQLGVKADANPGENNIAYVDDQGPLSFNVRCAELCGVWHGYMFNTGAVVPKAQFAAWIAQQQRSVRAGDQEPAAVLEDLLPATT